MDWWRQFVFRVRALFRRRRLEAEMHEELRSHLEMEAAHRQAAGLAPAEAVSAAQREFGGLEQAKDRCRDERGFRWLEQLAQDLRYAARQVRRSPGFFAIAIAILALGIGATTTIFSLVDGMMLKPLPYEQPGRLVQLFESQTPGQQNAVSPGVYHDWREQAVAFEGIAAYQGIALNFAGGETPEQVAGIRIAPNGLHLLRARPIAGRLFAPGEDQPGKANVIVITNALWQRRFGGDASVIGRDIAVDDRNYVVIGVLPDGFLPIHTQEFIVPFVMDGDSRNERGAHLLRVLGRVKPNVTLTQAQAELDTITQRIRPLFPAWKKEWSATLVPMREQLAQGIRPMLLLLLAAVGMVLMIACANVANLLLARSAARQREIAVRAALGAGRGRIIRQLLAESVFLAAAGTAIGVLLACWSVSGLRHLLGTMNFARVHDIAVDARVLGAAMAVSLLTGIGFGLAPALQSSRSALNRALKDAPRGSAAGGGRLRSALIVGEVALALILLVGTGLLLHSFARLAQAPIGFEAKNALSLNVSLANPKFPTSEQRGAIFNRMAEDLATLPGVEAAAITDALPLRGNPSDVFFRIAGRVHQPEQGFDVDIVLCTPDYFRALGVPLVRGRFFTADEAHRNARVAVINASMARTLFAGEDPIGQHLERDEKSWEIIGVVGDVRMGGLTRNFAPLVYRLSRGTASGWSSIGAVVVRTRTSPKALINDVLRRIHAIERAAPITNVSTLDEVVSSSVADRRLTLYLLGGFAGVAVLLAAIGLYGVVAYAVAQRTREFGIRTALGASGTDITRLVLGHGLRLVLLGLALGMLGALGLTRLLARLLFEVTPTDPVSFVATALLLLGIAMLASWLPARRAARVDPVTALRAE